jgi:hypothetical protein
MLNVLCFGDNGASDIRGEAVAADSASECGKDVIIRGNFRGCSASMIGEPEGESESPSCRA